MGLFIHCLKGKNISALHDSAGARMDGKQPLRFVLVMRVGEGLGLIVATKSYADLDGLLQIDKYESVVRNYA
jgi:hypothetical protein